MPGYGLLGAAFQFISTDHAFFLANVILLLISSACFIDTCRFFGVNRYAGSLIFLLSTVLNANILEQFVIPWSSTPTCAIIHILIWLFLKRSPRPSASFAVGILGSAIILFRPTDIVSISPVFIHIALLGARGFSAGRKAPAHLDAQQQFMFTLAGGIVGAAAVTAIYLAIHGFTLSEYLKISNDIGFTFTSFPIKFHVLFVNPLALYGQGTAILKLYPWLFLSFVGAVCLLFDRSRLATVSACVLLHIAFYSCYADLLPTNILHFKLIHYLKWTFPFLGLFAWLAARDMLGGRRAVPVMGCAVVLFVLLSVRIDLEKIALPGAALEPPQRFHASFEDMRPIAAIDLPVGPMRIDGLGSWPLSLEADGRSLRRYAEFLSIPQPYGLRLLFARPIDARRLDGVLERPFRMSPGTWEPVGQRYAYGFGWPCWLPPYGCETRTPVQGFHFPEGAEFSFEHGGNGTSLQARGLSGQEPWGTWTEGDEVTMEIPFDVEAMPPGRDFGITLEANAFTNGNHRRQSADVVVNDEFLTTFSVDGDEGIKTVSITVPRAIAAKRRPIAVVLRLRNAISPMDLGVSEDGRKLGLGLRRLVIGSVPSGTPAR
ncbi:hypothetical protein JL101_015435 [Skermanella rosea]|uniref:DUF7024 domain-containing protein n=1 Tax=Skermanella rosea TaxID=1817965 RepID=UPI001933313E|nr:hypothetical protein [Skermanella rosea]UEM01401.1 hypothetical protein JL101_015435 [Skermanella rosea]